MKKKRFTISMKIRIFVVTAVFIVSMSIGLISYYIGIDRIDNYIKRMTFNTAENYASLVDPEYIAELRKTAETEEFQKLRAEAVDKEDDSIIENYLKEKGLWDKYASTRKEMCNYLDNMEDIKYLYIIVLGDSSALYDMYLLDDYDNPLTQTGFFDDREPELKGIDTSKTIEPIITTGEWGWLCSAYAPICDADGNIICHVGCDFDMESIMSQRTSILLCAIFVPLGITVFMLLLTIVYFRLIFTKPVRRIIEESKKFDPQNYVPDDEKETNHYGKAGVIDIYTKKSNEITDIYDIIRATQISFIDYLDDMAKLEKDKQRYLEYPQTGRDRKQG